MGKHSGPEPITKAKIVLVEGQDEVHLFNELLIDLALDNDVEVHDTGGKDKLPASLRTLRGASGFNQVTSIGIVRDADRDANSAFLSVCSALHNATLPEPPAPLQVAVGPPQVTVVIVPGADKPGMIEDVCLSSVSDDPAMACVDRYFQCLQAQQRLLAESAIPKARVHAFLASREWLEIAHFEYLQQCMEHYTPVAPESPAVVVPKVHAFLASRYTPDLSLGIAAEKSDREDRYWRFDHPAFDELKQFLQML